MCRGKKKEFEEIIKFYLKPLNIIEEKSTSGVFVLLSQLIFDLLNNRVCFNPILQS